MECSRPPRVPYRCAVEGGYCSDARRPGCRQQRPGQIAEAGARYCAEAPQRSSTEAVPTGSNDGGVRPPLVDAAAKRTSHRAHPPDAALQPIKAFEAKISFSVKAANRQSLRKNHYHPGTWTKEGREEPEVARDFAHFLRRHASVERLSSAGETYRVAQLVAHNGSFDGAFLQEWYRRVGLFLPASRQVLCTIQRAMWYFAERPEVRSPKDMRLATLCDYFGVTFHAAAAHEALADVSAMVALYRALTQGNRAPLAAPLFQKLAAGTAGR